MTEPASKQVRRFDRIPFGHVTRGDDGSITSEAVITRTGIFSYQLPDGSIQHELRSPEEVFKGDSMKTARMLPITNNHPATVFVDPATVKDVTVGFTGENVSRADNTLVTPVKINTAEGIKAVDDGRRQFSCGYAAEVVRQDGVWEGTKYTHVQKNIKYNHLALVDKGRAGSVASLRLDAADACQVEDVPAAKEPKRRNTMPSQVKLDSGRSYDCAPEVADAVEAMRTQAGEMKAKLDAAGASVTAMTAERDTLKGSADELQKKVDGFAKTLDESVKAGITERAAILDGARKIITDKEEAVKLDDMSIADIRKAVIMHVNKDAKLDDENDDYIKGAFNILVAAGPVSKQDANGAAIIGDSSQKRADGAKDPEQARLDHMERVKATSRAPIGEAAAK